ncbi:hypothetical protein RKD29_005630 [Streptomyces tendae]
MQDVEAVAVVVGRVEAVQGEQHGRGQASQGAQHGQLVADAEVVGGLVQDEEGGLLGEGGR